MGKTCQPLLCAATLFHRLRLQQTQLPVQLRDEVFELRGLIVADIKIEIIRSSRLTWDLLCANAHGERGRCVLEFVAHLHDAAQLVGVLNADDAHVGKLCLLHGLEAPRLDDFGELGEYFGLHVAHCTSPACCATLITEWHSNVNRLFSAHLLDDAVLHGHLCKELPAHARDVWAVGNCEHAVGLVLIAEHAGFLILQALTNCFFEDLLAGIECDHCHCASPLAMPPV